MKEIVLKAEDIHVSFKDISKTSLKSFFKRDRNKGNFEALKGVSFEIERGDVIGLIGKNGSGKSTLLRTLANVFSPDQGTVDTFGHSISLMAIGNGFIRELTGRENIYLSGTLMGLKKTEIDQNVEKIIEFSELGAFIDKPVNTYSSGMYSKLAFAITTTVSPDIILIDEVLSVGDLAFKQKSTDRIMEIIKDEEKTVVIVSHSLDLLKTLCNKVIWLEEGNLVEYGDPIETIRKYRERFLNNK